MDCYLLSESCSFTFSVRYLGEKRFSTSLPCQRSEVMRVLLHSVKHALLLALIRWDRSASEGAGVALGLTRRT